jgi:hypothetical protein
MVSDLRESVVARRTALSAGLFENGIAALGAGVERWVFANKALGSRAEQGKAGAKLESVGASTHQFSIELLADGASDFFVTGADPPSLKLRAAEP